MNEEVGREIGSQMAERDAMLLGRRIYQEFAAVWPGRGTDNAMGAAMNNTPKYVASTTLDNVDDWQNSTLLGPNLTAGLDELKRQPGKNIAIIGSATLIQALLHQDAIDELVLFLVPIIVGKGRRLFDEYREQLPLKLLQTRSFTNGVVKLVYAPTNR